MKRLFFSIFLVACSSARGSSGGGPTPFDETAPAEDPAPLPPPASPSPPGFSSGSSGSALRGCPNTRPLEESASEMPSIDELRALLVGIYRECLDGSGVELRIDPDDATHMLWYRMDDRFVRMNGPEDYGWFTIDECSVYQCTTMWHVGNDDQQNGFRSLQLWRDPIAITVDSTSTGVRNEWVHVAK